MLAFQLQPIDYLIIGHLTRDLTPSGPRLGGTAAYAALTARALGLRVGVLTAASADLDLAPLGDLLVVVQSSPQTTTYENVPLGDGRRKQLIHACASRLDLKLIPEPWRRVPIVHFGPVADELHPVLPPFLNFTLLGLTPQGWMRSWGADGEVRHKRWEAPEALVSQAGAVVISVEDVDGDEDEIDRLAHLIPILVVTEGAAGARLYWHGDQRRFRAPRRREVDATGAGDIFAAAFFTRLYVTRDPWEAARFATALASCSVTRPGLEGVPTPAEIEASLMEVLP
ncbi:MAG: PfkB family carbohydrate kinase [Anaerolineales bacterium]